MRYTKARVHAGLLSRPAPVETRYPPRGELFYVKACNGAGKSTIPSICASRDPEAYTVSKDGRILLTVMPSYGMLAFGKYDNSKSKGVDSLRDYEEMKLAVELSELPEFVEYTAFFEGVIPSTILNTWIEFLDRPARRLITAFIDTDMQTCIERVGARNGGAEFNQQLVIDKYNRVKSHRDRHKELFPTVPAVIIRSQGITMDDMVSLFLNREFEGL